VLSVSVSKRAISLVETIASPTSHSQPGRYRSNKNCKKTCPANRLPYSDLSQMDPFGAVSQRIGLGAQILDVVRSGF
jgi:hypothetical protein